MSWQNVFKTAKRLGAPVIVTDHSGNEPLIVLPLEIFESLSGQDSQRTSTKQLAYDPEPNILNESIFEPSQDDQYGKNAKKMAEIKEKTGAKPFESGNGPEIGQTPEFSLEERFYFEPVDDENKK